MGDKKDFFGVKVMHVLKKSWYLFHEVENLKGWYCENNYGLFLMPFVLMWR